MARARTRIDPAAAVRAWRRLACLAACLATALACGGIGNPDTEWVPPDVPRVDENGLHLVTQNAHFQREYLKPGLDLSRYDTLLLVPLGLAYTEEWKRDRRFEDTEGPDAMVPGQLLATDDEDDVARLRKMFRQALQKELGGDSAYRFVDEPGPGVLVLTASVVDLDLAVPDTVANEDDSATYTEPPVVEIAAALEDGATHAKLADLLYTNRRDEAEEDLPAAAFWDVVDDAFGHWARRFRAMLDGLRAGPAAAGS